MNVSGLFDVSITFSSYHFDNIIILVDSDESCDGDHHTCLNDKCIPKGWICDGDNDCFDNTSALTPSSDEMNCGS